jgi:hypothetical protein
LTGEEINPSFNKESNGLSGETWHPVYTLNILVDAIIPDPEAARGDKK